MTEEAREILQDYYKGNPINFATQWLQNRLLYDHICYADEIVSPITLQAAEIKIRLDQEKEQIEKEKKEAQDILIAYQGSSVQFAIQLVHQNLFSYRHYQLAKYIVDDIILKAAQAIILQQEGKWRKEA